MEKLTIKELAPYLVYDLNGVLTPQKEVVTLTGIFVDRFGLHEVQINYNGCYALSRFKPILRPLYSIDLKWFQDNIDEALEDFRINCEPENNHFSVEVCEKVLGWSALSLEEYQLFYEHHVDIHGLIDRGLALPIEGKEVEGE